MLMIRCLLAGFMLCILPLGVNYSQTKPATPDRYLVFFLTNTTVQQAGERSTGKDANDAYSFVGEIPHLFGPLNPDSPVKYAFGLPGPMLLTQSPQQMREQVNQAFDLAEQYNVPVYFQLDDINNYTSEFGNDAHPKFYEEPEWCEWVGQPADGDSQGGRSFDRLPRYWFNWGAWRFSPAFPNLASPGFNRFVKKQLAEGVLPALVDRYELLKAGGKEYLFAGMAIGWETHIPDYSGDNPIYAVNPNALPFSKHQNDRMAPWEASKYGYAALHTLGIKSYDREALYRVIRNYSASLARVVFEAGIPKHKIFTHTIGLKSVRPELETTFAPPIWVAVNPYSTPGFTMSPETCPYDLEVIKSEISRADSTQKHFANAEGYARGLNKDVETASAYLNSMFNQGALITTVFGWGRESATSAFAVSHSPYSPFVIAAKELFENDR